MGQRSELLESIGALLREAIDYAGLFPPAGLGMREALDNYSRCAGSAEGWMIGRFILPVSRLSEFETLLVSAPPTSKWRLSVLTGSDLPRAIPAVLAFNAHVRDAVIDTLEAKADSLEVVRRGVEAVPGGFATYFEIPSDRDPIPLLTAIAAGKCRAKIRTGGVEESLFPGIDEVARFIRCCDEMKVPFKATAGLHHAVRGRHALTHEPLSATTTMHGFLNVLLAAAFVWAGISDAEMKQLLGEQDAPFKVSRKGIGWAQRWISTQQVESARQRLMIGFGSCSFEEPVQELKGLRLV